MDVLMVGCGWVSTYIAAGLIRRGNHVWATCRSAEKVSALEARGIVAAVADFDGEGPVAEPGRTAFDVAIISVPVGRNENAGIIYQRFVRLAAFLGRLSFNQSFFFSSVGIYPQVNATISETTFTDDRLDQKLLSGEQALRSVCPDINVLRLGGLFGEDRILAKYFAGRICETGYQPANFVHVEDIRGVVMAMMAAGSQAKTYNVVAPEHPLKKDVIAVSASKYGYDLPAAFTETDRTTKVVSADGLIAGLGYMFAYPSPLGF